MKQADIIWEVIGGKEKGGIVVRSSFSIDSIKLGRLEYGATVKQLHQKSGRLHYKLLHGRCPVQQGWVSLEANGKILLQRKTQTIWVVAQGYHDDVKPLLVLGRELQALCDVAVLTSRKFGKTIEALGLRFAPLDVLKCLKPVANCGSGTCKHDDGAGNLDKKAAIKVVHRLTSLMDHDPPEMIIFNSLALFTPWVVKSKVLHCKLMKLELFPYIKNDSFIMQDYVVIRRQLKQACSGEEDVLGGFQDFRNWSLTHTIIASELNFSERMMDYLYEPRTQERDQLWEMWKNCVMGLLLHDGDWPQCDRDVTQGFLDGVALNSARKVYIDILDHAEDDSAAILEKILCSLEELEYFAIIKMKEKPSNRVSELVNSAYWKKWSHQTLDPLTRLQIEGGCHLVIHQGTPCTTFDTLLAGKPSLVIPLTMTDMLHAEWIHEKELGICIRRHISMDNEGWKSKIEECLDSITFTQKLQSIKNTIKIDAVNRIAPKVWKTLRGNHNEPSTLM